MGFFDNLFGRNNPKPSAQPTFSPSATGPFVFPGLDENFQTIYPAIHKFGPGIPNYSTYSDRQLAECFLPQNWSAEGFGDRQKEALLQEVNNRFAAAHHLPAIPVRVRSDMNPNDMGTYDPASRSIELNPKYLDNPFEALDSVTHESQHYVDDMNVRNGTGDTPENLAVYACENSSGGYGQPPEGDKETNPAWQATCNYYNAQALEAHANNAGFAAVASHHDLYKNCPEYSKYLEDRAKYFDNVKGSLTSDPEKWNALEQAHIRNATGQSPETIKMACAEQQRGTDAQQKAILNADAVKMLQHDCARQQSTAQTQPGTAHNQNAAATSPGQDNSLHRTGPPESAPEDGSERMRRAPEADKSNAPTSSRSQHDAFVESLRVKPGQGAGQGAGQSSGTATDGAPEPPERERERTRDDGEERMRRAPEADTSDTPTNAEEQNTENTKAPETGQAQQPAAENQTESSEPSESRADGKSQPAEQTSEEEGQAPRADSEAPEDGEDAAPDREEPAPEAEVNKDASEESQDQDNGENQPAEQAPEEEGQTPRAEDEAPDNGDNEAHDREEPAPNEEEGEGIQDHPQEDAHGPNDGPGQTAAEEEEGIREPDPEQENAHGAEEADGIRKEPSAPRENTADEDEGIRDQPREESPREEDDGIRNEPEAADAAQPQDDQSEGISGQDTAPAPSEGAEQSMGQ